LPLTEWIWPYNLRRIAESEARDRQVPKQERFAADLFRAAYERNALEEMSVFAPGGAPDREKRRTALPLAKYMKDQTATSEASGDALLKFSRRHEPKGPLAVFGYDYFAEHAKVAEMATPKLLSYEGLWGSGEEYAYEVLNFADGKRNAQEIRDAVSAEYGPIPLELVVEYLKALEKIGVVEQVK